MEKQKIFIFISDIAAYIGQNKYDIITPFERLWKRCDKQDYNNIIQSNKNDLVDLKMGIVCLEKEKDLLKDDLDQKKITKRQYNTLLKEKETKITNENKKIEELETKIDNIHLNQEEKLTKLIGKEEVNKIRSDKIETDEKKQEINTLLENMNISEDKKKFLKKETESFINKTHGTLKEDSAIEMFQKRHNVLLDTSQEFYKYRLEMSDNSDYEWYIGGKMDGIYIDENGENDSYVVEVKNRMRGFFNSLRDYEKTQIHIYMFLIDVYIAKLVEKYGNKIRITSIYRDEEYLNDIFEYLNIFIHSFENNFLKNKDLKIKYVSRDDKEKQKILQNLYLKEINNRIYKKLHSSDTDESDDDCLISDY